MVEHFMQDINKQLAQIYWQTDVLSDRINKEKHLKEDIIEKDKAEEFLKVHLVNWKDLLKKSEITKRLKM